MSEIVAQSVSDAKCAKCGAALPAEAQPLSQVTCSACGQAVMVPGKLGQYRLERLIGCGGMGAVYEGIDEGLNRKVAVKVILREKAAEDPTFIESFKREAQAAAKLNNMNIVAVYAFGDSEGQPFLAMELVQPDSLDRMMKQGPVMPATVLNIGHQIAQGLKAAADQGLVHGDVKPENILINEAREAKLADFGIAALMGAAAANKNEVWGTPFYIAPETLKKQKVDFRADIYSLGGTLYHAIAGVPPFDGVDEIATMKARLEGPARPLHEVAPHCPEGISKIVMRMLEAEPARRYPTYESLLNDMAKELRAAKNTIGGGKRIVLKGKTAPSLKLRDPDGDPSRPMPVVGNPNAPLVQKKKGLSTGAIIGIGVGGFLLVVGVIVGVIVMVAGGDEKPAAAAQETPSAVATPQVAPEVAELKALNAELAKRVKDAQAAQAEAKKLVAWIVDTTKKRYAVAEHAQWLEPSTEEPPTAFLKTLQSVYAQDAELAALVEGLDALAKKVEQLSFDEEPATALKTAEAEVKAFDDAHPKSAKQLLKSLETLRKSWGKHLDGGRDEWNRELIRRQEEADKAAKEAAKLEAAEREKQKIEEELAEVTRMDNSLRADLDRFMPEETLKKFQLRQKALVSREAKNKAKLTEERINVYLRFKKWLIAEATAGTFKDFGITAADEKTVTFANEPTPLAWSALKNPHHLLFARMIIKRISDDVGSKDVFTLTSKRAEQAVAARLFLRHFLPPEQLEMKTMREAMERLKLLAEGVPRTAAELTRLEGTDTDAAAEE